MSSHCFPVSHPLDRRIRSREWTLALSLLLAFGLPAESGAQIGQEQPVPRTTPGAFGGTTHHALPPVVRPIRAGGLRAEIAAVILSGQQGGQIALETLVVPTTVHEGKVRVSVLLEIGGQSLLQASSTASAPDQTASASDQEESAEPLRFEIFVYALSGEGALQGSLIQTYEADRDRLEGLLGSGFKFLGDLDLRPGEYSLRTLVRHSASGKMGLRVRDIVVPDASRASLGPPLFAEPGDHWLALREGRERGQAARPPLAFLTPPDRPTGRPVLVSGKGAGFRLLVHDSATAPADTGAVEIRMTNERSGDRLEIGAEILRVSDSLPESDPLLRQVDARFELGTTAPGLYRLEVMLGSEEHRIASPAVPVMVLPFPGSEPAPAIAWAEVTPAMFSGRTYQRTAAVAEIGERERRRRARDLKSDVLVQQYDAVVADLAKGELATARRGLFELTMAQMDQGLAGLDALAEVEKEASARIAEAEPAGLAALTTLHHWLYQDTRAHKVSLASTHARSVTLDLVELYLRTGLSIQAKRQASAVLVSLGCELQRAGMSRLGERLLQRVLTLDHGNDIALLNLGAAAEIRGEYDLAVGFLSELVDAHPLHGEGRLRLAINLLRLDRRRAARRHLETLVEGQHRRWVLSLAYQELAKLHLAANHMEEAHDLLEKALGRLPGDEKLHLQMAFVYDARNEIWKSNETLQRMTLRGGRRDRVSPRHVYTEWPEANLAEIRRSLEVAAEEQVADLERALGRSIQQAGGR